MSFLLANSYHDFELNNINKSTLTLSWIALLIVFLLLSDHCLTILLLFCSILYPKPAGERWLSREDHAPFSLSQFDSPQKTYGEDLLSLHSFYSLLPRQTNKQQPLTFNKDGVFILNTGSFQCQRKLILFKKLKIVLQVREEENHT